MIVGLLWQVGGKLGFGRLPGDIVLGRGNVRVYIPIATGLLVSVVVTLAFLLARLFSR